MLKIKANKSRNRVKVYPNKNGFLVNVEIVCQKYYFGNKFFVNYLQRVIRDRLVPHVRVYSRRDLQRLFDGLPLTSEVRTTIFGAYDNIIEKFPIFGGVVRAVLQFLERTPFNRLGLSHFWVYRKE